MSNLNVENRTLYHGDNLPFLRNLNSESVHLIATDPPFNKNKDFHATPDSLAAGASFQDRWSWERDVHQEWVDQITDDYPQLMEAIESARYAHSDGMGAFMCFMAVRLMEMRRILRKDGSIYLHCDPTASHYLKAIMDAIFEWKQFRNEIVWERTIGRSDARRFARVHDVILYYTKENKFIWNGAWQPLTYEQIERDYKHEDKKGKYQPTSLTTQGLSGGGYEYEFHGHTGPWRYPKNKMLELEKEGRIWLPQKADGMPRYKRYLYESKGIAARDVITDIQRSPKSERTGYPTQKPTSLYERIIKASSNEGDIVLDPFCGCATTLVAAEQLKRKWIGADIWDKAHDVVIERLKKDGDIKNNLFEQKSIIYTKELPERTDEGEEAAPNQQVRERVKEPPNPYKSRQAMYEFLLTQYGSKCQGCDREFNDSRYLELDHNTPKSSGGLNHISNRILLCGPCNKLKSNIYALPGLRRQNKKRGYMVGQNES